MDSLFALWCGVVEELQIRWILVTFFILVNLFFSVWEAIVCKDFQWKKLPLFATEWVISIMVVTVVEVVVLLINVNSIIYTMFAGLKDIMLLAILGAYFKRMLESIKGIGWCVDTKKIHNYLEKGEDAMMQKTFDKYVTEDMTDLGDMSVDDVDVSEHVEDGEEDVEKGDAV